MIEGLSFSPQLSDLQAWQLQFDAVYASHPIIVSLIYLIAFTLITALCLPGASVLMLLSGASLGLWTGTLLGTLASALGATMTLLAVRLGWRARTEQRWHTQLDVVNMGLAQHGALYVLWLRLVPLIPFVPLNILCGLTRLSVTRFAAASFAGMLPGTAVYVNAGAQLAQLQSLDDLWSPPMVGAVLMLLVLSGLPLLKPLGQRLLGLKT
jgi:uncharacterized membrane protein YdjX (TVP38/TMEM64 family)